MAFIEFRRFDEAIVAAKKAQRRSPSFPVAFGSACIRLGCTRSEI
jgi:hypothetical protein